MANMTAQGWQIYIEAHQLWIGGQFYKAEERLAELKAAGCFAVSKVQLLQAYIKRSLGEILAEIGILEALVKSGCEDEPGLLAGVYSMLGQAYSMLGSADKAVEVFLRSVDCEESQEQKLAEYSNAIFAAAALPGTDKEFWQVLYAGYEALLKECNIKAYTAASKAWQHTKLRIGYISCDYHQHPVSSLLWPLVDKADRDNFMILCYAANQMNDKITEAFRDCADVWRQVSNMSYGDMARLIHADEIDILVDLGGHTSGNMLPVLAYKPAKVQISAIGWVGSTGMQSVDYVLGDEFCSPQEKQEAYVEKLLAVNGSHFCFHVFKSMPDVMPAPYLINGYVTFGCFNNFSKITDDMLIAWGKILANVPGSRLLLKHKIFNDQSGRAYTLKRLEHCGINGDKVELREFSSDYLEQYGDMDIALDTFPYTGGMTTFEAMYMGVPVVSLYGDSRGQRFGYSMLMNAGLEDLTTANINEYVDIATALGNHPEVVAELRGQLRGMVKKSPLMDEAAYTRNVEKAYQNILAKISEI